MSKIPNVLFPFNGQMFTFEGFVKQLDMVIDSVRVYDTNVARKPDGKIKKEIIRALAEHFKAKDE